VGESGKVRIVSFFGVKIAKKYGGGKSQNYGISLHRFLKWYGKWKGRVTAHEVIRRKCHLNALRAGIFA